MASDLDARVRRQEREERDQWMKERAEMLAENQRLRDQLARITRRFKLTQTALVEQQKVLDRYQQELVRCGSKAPQADPESSDPLFKKWNAENVCNDQSDQDTAKRAKLLPGTKQRHSLPLTEHTDGTSGSHSSPSRRRSLPEVHRSSATGVIKNESADQAWVTRRKDIESARAPTVVNATELLRPRQLVRPRPSLPATTTMATSRKPRVEAAADSDDEFLNDHDAIGRDDKKSALVKTEPERTPLAVPRERAACDRPDRLPSRRRELPFRSDRIEPKTARPPTPPRSRGATASTFAYVEVVRNREERAALPGYDCVECRKYYEALDGLVPEHEMKALCSRHRARFEPYQTPDDFWRLSFPDSQSQDMLSP